MEQLPSDWLGKRSVLSHVPPQHQSRGSHWLTGLLSHSVRPMVFCFKRSIQIPRGLPQASFFSLLSASSRSGFPVVNHDATCCCFGVSVAEAGPYSLAVASSPYFCLGRSSESSSLFRLGFSEFLKGLKNSRRPARCLFLSQGRLFVFISSEQQAEPVGEPEFRAALTSFFFWS